MDIMNMLRREATNQWCMFLYHKRGDVWCAYGLSAYFAAGLFPFTISYTQQITADIIMWGTEVFLSVNNLQSFIDVDRECAVIRLNKFIDATIDNDAVLEWGKRLPLRYTVSMVPECVSIEDV